MSFKGELFLTWKYLKFQKSVISVLTYISLFGPLLGVAILTVVIAVMNGIPREYEKKIIAYTAQIQIRSDQDPIDDNRALIEHLKSKYQLNASPVSIGPVLLENMQQQSEVFLAKGVLPEFDQHVSKVKEMLVDQTEPAAAPTQKAQAPEYHLDKGQIIVSLAVKEMLGLSKGDTVIVHSPQKYQESLNKELDENESFEAKTMRLKISGFFNTGVPDIDENIVLLNLSTLNELLLMKPNSCHQIEVGLEDYNAAGEMAATLQQDPLLKYYQCIPWQEQPEIQNIKLLIENQKSLIVFVLFFIIVGAAIAVAACLFSLVIQKTKEIGILKATGMKPSAIILTFLGVGSALGTLGSGLGVIAGLVILHFRGAIAKAFGFWDVRLYRLDYVPAFFDFSDIFIVFISSVFICGAAALLPAAIAASINPVKALQSKG